MLVTRFQLNCLITAIPLYFLIYTTQALATQPGLLYKREDKYPNVTADAVCVAQTCIIGPTGLSGQYTT